MSIDFGQRSTEENPLDDTNHQLYGTNGGSNYITFNTHLHNHRRVYPGVCGDR